MSLWTFLFGQRKPPTIAPQWRQCIASEFATIEDLAAYRRAKARGLSDKEAFKVGDNGIGKWGDITATEAANLVALPPEDWEPQTARMSAKPNALRLYISYNGQTVLARLGDTMPHRQNIKNGAGIDLNPGCCKALAVPAGAMVTVKWAWA